MEKLGDRLYKNIFNKFEYSIATVGSMGIQLIERVEAMHAKGIVHIDIKTRNILLGLNNNLLYLIDLGLSRKYIENGIIL